MRLVCLFTDGWLFVLSAEGRLSLPFPLSSPSFPWVNIFFTSPFFFSLSMDTTERGSHSWTWRAFLH